MSTETQAATVSRSRVPAEDFGSQAMCVYPVELRARLTRMLAKELWSAKWEPRINSSIPPLCPRIAPARAEPLDRTRHEPADDTAANARTP